MNKRILILVFLTLAFAALAVLCYYDQIIIFGKTI